MNIKKENIKYCNCKYVFDFLKGPTNHERLNVKFISLSIFILKLTHTKFQVIYFYSSCDTDIQTDGRMDTIVSQSRILFNLFVRNPKKKVGINPNAEII